MLLNCRIGEDSWESFGQQGDPPVHPKGDQSWVFIGRTNVEAETPILCLPEWRTLIWTWTSFDPDAGKDWRQEEKGTIEDEMVGWHHRLSGYEFELTLGIGNGQGGLVCCSPWGHRVGHGWATELESSWTRDQTYVPCTGRQIPTHCVTREVLHHIWKWKISQLGIILITVLIYLNHWLFVILPFSCLLNQIIGCFRSFLIFPLRNEHPIDACCCCCC